MFLDRRDAGRALATRLERHRHTDAVVLGVTRPGVVVADEVARTLGLPLDVTVLRRVAAGADDLGVVGEDGVERLRPAAAASDAAPAIDRARRIAAAIAERFRHGRPARDLTGRTAIVVDDGIRTGLAMAAACAIARARGAATVIAATPVGPAADAPTPDGADELVSLRRPAAVPPRTAVYATCPVVSDAEVERIAAEWPSSRVTRVARPVRRGAR